MTREEFYEYSNRLYDCYCLFLDKYEKKIFTLYLSDGLIVKIKMEEENVPHLLGLIPEKLKNLSIFRNFDYNVECLKKIIMDKEKCYECISQELDDDDYFSYFWRKKVNSFSNIKGFDAKNISFTSFYNQNIVPRNNPKVRNSEFVLGFKREKTTSIIGLKKNDGIYVPITNLLVPNSELGDYMENQVLIPTFSTALKDLKTGISKKIYYNQSAKIAKMEEVREIKQVGRFSSIDVSGEYFHTLNKLDELKTSVEELELELEEIQPLSTPKYYKDYLTEEEIVILSKLIFEDTEIDILLFSKALNALTKKEVSLIRDVFIDKKDELANIALKYQYNNYQTMTYQIEKSLHFLKEVYQGLMVKDPYIELLCSKLDITKEVLNLDEEKRTLMLLKLPLLDDQRSNKKEVIEELKINYQKYDELEQEAINELREVGKKYQKAI